MKIVATAIMVTGLSALMALAASATATAMTMPDLQVPQRSDVVKAGHHHGDHHEHYHHHHRGHRWHGDDGYYDDDTGSGLLFKSFVTGTLFSHTARQTADSHAQACANRYRTYRAADNSYQPSHGPRRQCR